MKHLNIKIYLLLFCLNACILKSKTNDISFTENKGQVSDQNYKSRPDVLFYGNTNDMVYHLRNNGISYQLSRVDAWKEKKDGLLNKIIQVPDQTTLYRLDINWLNVNTNAAIVKVNTLEGFNNYYLTGCPNGILNVKSYQEIIYKDLYAGINLKWYQQNGQLKYDYIVSAGSDYKKIQLEIKGAEKISLNAKGELIIKTPLGEITEQAPLVKQSGKILTANWQIKKNYISFNIEGIDTLKEFIIDPAITSRVWGTYFGGAAEERAAQCLTDANGDLFFVGFSLSSTNIATTGSYQSVYAGGGPNIGDAFLAKFNALGVRQWCTYYGGPVEDSATSLAFDNLNNIYISGGTLSTSGISTPGAYQVSSAGVSEAFLVKFNSSGVRLWATYYGDQYNDQAISCFTDNANNIYMVGRGYSSSLNALATPGSHQPVCGGGDDVFLVKFNSAGARLWGTYYGATGDESAEGCIDVFGNIYLTGTTKIAATGTIIATTGCHQPAFAGGTSDGFLVKFNTNGIRQWATYYGGANADMPVSCMTDTIGNVFIAGYTASNTSTDIATPGTFQPVYGGGAFDGFLAKFNTNGVRQWGTYYGGTGEELFIFGYADKLGNTYIPGYTTSNTGTAIATPGSHQTTYGGGVTDGFFTKIDPAGQREWGTYYGGANEEIINWITKDLYGNIYLTGFTASTNGTSIATNGSYQPAYAGGNYDCLIAKFSDCTLPSAPLNTTPSANMTICTNQATLLSATATGSLSWFTSAVGGSSIFTGTVFNTPTLTTGTTYYVEAITCAPSVTRTAIQVNVNPLPVIVVNDGFICFGQSFTIIPGGATTYTFSGGNAVVNPTTTTTYSITGTNSFGCISYIPAISTVTVASLPILTVSATNSSICIGESATLTAVGANTFSWSSGGVNSYEVVAPGVTTTYTVTGTSVEGCTNTAIITENVDVCLGTFTHVLDPFFKINSYPNPNTGEFTIALNKVEGEIYLEIYNATGQVIRKQHLTGLYDHIKISEFANGIYNLIIYKNNSPIYKEKIIKE